MSWGLTEFTGPICNYEKKDKKCRFFSFACTDTRSRSFFSDSDTGLLPLLSRRMFTEILRNISKILRIFLILKFIGICEKYEVYV